MNGIEMMLKAALQNVGLQPDKIMGLAQQYENLMLGLQQTLPKMLESQQRTEGMVRAMAEKMGVLGPEGVGQEHELTGLLEQSPEIVAEMARQMGVSNGPGDS